MNSSNILIYIGIGLIVLGILFSGKLGLGRLPGDIVVSRPGFTFFFPVVSMILLSVILSLVLNFFRK